MARKLKRTITQAPQRKFEKVGTEHVGRLNAIRKVEVEGEERIIYDLTDDDGAAFVIWSSAVLEQMIDDNMIGEIIGVTFTDQKPASKKGQNPTRLFKVDVYEISK